MDYRALLDNISEIVLVVDPAGVIRYLNSALETGLGYAATEEVGKPVWRLIHPDDLTMLDRQIQHRLSGRGDPAELQEIRIKHRNESWRTFQVRSRCLDSAGNAPAVLIMARDITEYRRLEEQLARAQRLEAVGLLASGVAHDFNNLLTGIKGYADLLLYSLEATDPRYNDVEQIRKAATRATGLTRQLLAFSRRQKLEPQVLDPGALINDLKSMLRRLINENVEIRTHIPETGIGRVAADRSQLEQVMINLVVNARDAMPGGGQLSIEVDEMRLDDDEAYAPLQPGRYIRIQVSDTGSGMDAETQRRIFEPFFTTKGLGEGTGLGLSTVYAIAQQSGGAVSVRSTVGVGSTFQILLPRVQLAADPAPPEQSAIDRATGGSETVLLVEDESVVRDLVHRVLRLQGYQVITARDGGEALRLAERYPDEIHLLLSDVIMPQLGGAELARLLLRARPRLRVLLISGHADESVIDYDDFDPARMAFFDKPFTMDTLTRKVRELLDAGRDHQG